tara:strand:+ start:2546 stop:4597 length:2052 start_codon:yes stop_codon:yes gene_type:complete
MSIPFSTKGGLLAHGNLKQKDLLEYVPINYILENIHNGYHLEKRNFFIISAATGSGKSVSIPIYCYNKYKSHKICLLQPKILTIEQLTDNFIQESQPGNEKSDNGWIYDLLGQKLEMGKNLSVKYSAKHEYCQSQNCLELASYGTFLKTLEFNINKLNEYKVIICDEIHEDSNEVIEFLLKLYYNKERENLPIIILTSATLNIKKFQKYFEIPIENIFEVEGKSYEKIINYTINDIENIYEKIYEILIKIIENDKLHYDILIFSYSKKNIEYIIEYLLKKGLKNKYNEIELIKITREIILLKEEEKEKYDRNNMETDLKTRKRMIIVSTNLAETGVTINQLKYVINIGIEKNNEYIPYLNSYILYDTNISKSSEIQRNGRVGRRFNGYVYNLYTAESSKMLPNQRYPYIITNDISIKLLKNLNKMKYIEEIPMELIYDGVYKLFILGYINFNEVYKIEEINKSIKYDENKGYQVDASISVIGKICLEILKNLEDKVETEINLNDIKFIILSKFFNMNLTETCTIISMLKRYSGDDLTTTSNNDFLELLEIYNKLIKDDELIHNKKKLSSTKIQEVIIMKHELLKCLYMIGFDINQENHNNFLNKHIKNKFIINKLFYYSYLDKNIINKTYRDRYINVRTNSECITNEIYINKKNNKYEMFSKYICIFDKDNVFNDKSYSLYYE